jgi:hypothetical protein
MKTLFGGSDQQSTSQGKSGFALLPKAIQDSFTNLATQSSNLLAPNGGAPNASMFTLPSLNPNSSSALSQIAGQDFAITPDRLKSNIAMQTNPYDSSVIDTINREAQGQGSVLKSMLTDSGTFGSNRTALGANDIDLTRLNQIGTFKNAEFQNALNNALTVIPQNQAQSAEGSVQAGLTQQGQQMQNQQAPASALTLLAQLMGVLPQTGGSEQTGSSTASSQNGMFAPMKLLSDKRLKENIVYRGMENGHAVYDFNYTFDRDSTYRGVMAQDVMLTNPDAVEFDGQYYRVDYSKIGVNFREIYG